MRICLEADLAEEQLDGNSQSRCFLNVEHPGLGVFIGFMWKSIRLHWPPKGVSAHINTQHRIIANNIRSYAGGLALWPL